MAASSISFYAIAYATSGSLFSKAFTYSNEYVYSTMYLQISVGIETMIFSCRNPYDWFWKGEAPCFLLVASVVLANAIVILMCCFGIIVRELSLGDIGMVIVYDVAVFALIDAVKVMTAQIIYSDVVEWLHEYFTCDERGQGSEEKSCGSEVEDNGSAGEDGEESKAQVEEGGGPPSSIADVEHAEEALRNLNISRPEDPLSLLFQEAKERFWGSRLACERRKV